MHAWLYVIESVDCANSSVGPCDFHLTGEEAEAPCHAADRVRSKYGAVTAAAQLFPLCSVIPHL